MILKTDDFAGIQPIIAPHNLGPNQAQRAYNCKFINGKLQSWRDSGSIIAVPSGTQSIFLYMGLHWLTSVHDQDIVVGPIINDDKDRIYKTSDNTYPEMSFEGKAENDIWYKLGVPTPDNAPGVSDGYTLPTGTITAISSVSTLKVTSAGHGLSDGDRITITMPVGMTVLDSNTYGVKVVDDDNFELIGTVYDENYPYEAAGSWELFRDESEKETRAYAYTFVTNQGEEGPPSDLETIDVYADAEVYISEMDVPVTGAHDFSGAALKRIYRSVTATNGTELYLVGEVAIGAVTFTDDIDPEELGEPLPSADWDMPHEDMQGLVVMPNGILAGFKGRDICFSVPFMPHAWPVNYRLSVDSDIVALGVFGQSMVVATKERPYIVTGTDPSGMSLEKLEINQSCVSKRGLVDMGYSVIYPSPDGLVEIRNGAVNLVTRTVFSRDQWQALNPEAIVAFFWEGRYCFFTEEAGYLYVPSEPNLSELEAGASAGYTDLEHDELYFLRGTNLLQVEGDTSLSQYDWKSKLFRLPKPLNFSCAQVVRADSGDVTFKLYADGELIHTQMVTDSLPFRLPGGFLALEYEYQLTGDAEVSAVYVSNSMAELRQV